MTNPTVDSLFADAKVNQEALRRRSMTRWGANQPDVIPLTAAESDFPAPQVVIDAITAFLEDGYLPYTPPDGMLELRDLVAVVSGTRYGIRAEPEQVVVTAGTAAAIWIATQALCQAGDECIILDPVDLLFGQAVDAAGARRVYWPVDKVTGHLDPEQLESLITPRTALILLCNPHNPLGVSFPSATMHAIGEIAARYRIPIVCDEVWNEIVYEPARHVSLSSINTDPALQVYTLIGPSKTFSLPGLRIGFIIAPDATAAHRLQATTHRLGASHSVTPLAQLATIAALQHGWPWRDAFLRHLRRMRDHCVGRLNSIPGISCRSPDSTYVLFPDISAYGLSSKQFADALLQTARVATVPGTAEWFGPGAEGNFRISFATSYSVIDQALDRIEQFDAGAARRSSLT
ncbi:pyridoxal phosphate-dependent aminotransferase [Saccharopolyspora sp. NPDC000995]